jgi:uncharacterized protein (TIGR00255 family)
MTGHGQSALKHGEIAVDVEIRTVNNRFLKVNSKISDTATSLEPQIEGIIREYLKRGSVNVSVRVSQMGRNNASTINRLTLEDYLTQSEAIAKKIGIQLQYQVGELLLLPGVLESARQLDDESLLEVVRDGLKSALEDLQSMRHREGVAMAAQLTSSLEQIDAFRKQIELRAPDVVTDYRNKLEQRVRAGLASVGQQVGEFDLLREVLLYADRCDISEEITRLNSHLHQFRQAISHPESQGRRLDFLIQELFRETNTIGAKANDSQISQWVVSIKTTIEQMRELIQNVE